MLNLCRKPCLPRLLGFSFLRTAFAALSWQLPATAAVKQQPGVTSTRHKLKKQSQFHSMIRNVHRFMFQTPAHEPSCNKKKCLIRGSSHILHPASEVDRKNATRLLSYNKVGSRAELGANWFSTTNDHRDHLR